MALAINIEDLLYKQKIAPYYIPRTSVDNDKKDDSLEASTRSSLDSVTEQFIEQFTQNKV